METTSKSKVAIPLVAAIPIQYSTIPINIFNGKVKTGIKIQQTLPYPLILNGKPTDRSKKSCTNCNNEQKRDLTATGKQNPVSNMYSSPMIILPFISAKPTSQVQQKALSSMYNPPASLYHQQHVKNSEDTSRVIKNLHSFPQSKYFFYFNEFSLLSRNKSLGKRTYSLRSG